MGDQTTRISELERRLEEATTTLKRVTALDQRGRANANRLAFKVGRFFGIVFGTITALLIFTAGCFLGIRGWPLWSEIVVGYAFWFIYAFAWRRHTWLKGARDQMSAILEEYERNHSLLGR